MKWKSRLRLALIGTFLGASLVLLSLFNASKPRIMVVHSLNSASSWTSGVDRGIDQVLARNRLPVLVQRDYLNLDILSEGISLQTVTAGVRQRIDRFDPDILIAVDDESSDLIARRYVNRNRPKIIYTSLMHPPERYGYTPESGVSGIQEELPLNGIGALLDQLFPADALNITVLGVSDLTGTAEMAQILRHDWGRHRIVSHALVRDFESWKSFVHESAKGSNLLLVLSADKVPVRANGHDMASETEVIGWTERNAHAWPVGVRASYVSHGGGIAISASPNQLGAMAIEFALEQTTKTAQASTFKRMHSSSYDVSVRPSALSRRGITLPTIYTEAARGAGRLYE